VITAETVTGDGEVQLLYKDDDKHRQQAGE
jgi:hypothetical protein